MKPKRKKTANHAIGPPSPCRIARLAGDGEPDDRDRGEHQDLPHREDRVADHLAGQQRPHRDRRDEQLDDARLLLFDDALRDRAAEQRRREQEHDAEADRDEVAQAPRPSVGVEQLDRRQLREREQQLRRRARVGDDREARAARTESATIAASTSPELDERLGLGAVGDIGDVEARARPARTAAASGVTATGVPARATGLEAAPDHERERAEEQDDRRDQEGLAAQLRADLALGDEPDALRDAGLTWCVDVLTG